MKLVFATVLFSTFLISSRVHGDCFMHNPRGSNDRLNGANANRANGNRLFDSQNNAKGGYNVGDKGAGASNSEKTQYNMVYFQSGKDYRIESGRTGKSFLTVEWTNQHGCGHDNLNCNILLQYKCQPDTGTTLTYNTIRNGATTSTILYKKNTYSSRSSKDSYMKSYAKTNYGLHEPFEWYDKCAKRKRNKGLFTADRNLNGDTSIYTRQNNGGTRNGYECPEERDYYPYWHPTDWIDIAVLANNESDCKRFQDESFNVRSKGECLEYYSKKTEGFRHDSVHNNKIDCEKNKGFWVEFSNYLERSALHTTEKKCKAASTKSTPLIWAIPYRSEDIDKLKMTGDDVKSLYSCLVALPPPDCRKAPYTRPNHLGNTVNVVTMNYTWVLPYFPSRKPKKCVLRIRYNISTGDYDPCDTYSDQNNDPNNRVFSPVQNNPKVKVGFVQLPLQLAVNTAQFGRVFQDRSHVFKILPRPKGVSEKDVINNVNVRGKRGNIVQVYPAVEYDFVPNDLTVDEKELVHFQWTGSNTNPNGNDGQGTAKTDRNNIVEMARPNVNYPLESGKPLTMFRNAEILWSSDIATKTHEDLILSMASAGYYNSMEMCHASPKKTQMDVTLNNAAASYAGMLLRFKAGTYYYMCTRNNNFTNRNQKARLTVTSSSSKARREFEKAFGPARKTV